MSLFLKIALFIASLSVIAGLFIANKYRVREEFQSARQSAVEYFNPAEKERRLLDELAENIAKIEQNILSDLEQQPLEDNLTKTQTFIDGSREIIQQIQEINEDKRSTISAGISRIRDLIKKDSQTKMLYQTPDGKEYLCTPFND